MKIQKEPYKIDFAGNCPEFVLRTTPNYNNGKCYSRTFAVNALPEGELVMEIDESVLTWQLLANPTDDLWQMFAVDGGAQAMLDTLEAKLVYNPILNREFTASCSVSNGVLLMKITAKNPGSHVVTLRHTLSPLHITTKGIITGACQTPKLNYRVRAWFSVLKTDGSTLMSPEMTFEDSNGTVRVLTDVLQPLFNKPDIPAFNEKDTVRHCDSATLTARLYALEMHSDYLHESPTIRTILHSRKIILVNGKVQQYAAINNLPDWRSVDPKHLHLKTGLDIFGQDNNDNITCPPGSVQYLYVYNYGETTLTCNLKSSTVAYDGTTEDGEPISLSISPGVSRVSVSIPESGVVSKKVWLEGTGISRTFTLRDFEYGFHTFLMLNSLNLYETFIVEYLAREEQTDGERRVFAKVDSYTTTDSQTVYIARCTPRNANGLKLLRSAFAKQHNLLLEGEFAWYIDMLPGSLQTSDEGADLMEAEFKFRLRDKVNRNPQMLQIAEIIEPTQQIMSHDTTLK